MSRVLLVLMSVLPACDPELSSRRCNGNDVERFGTLDNDHDHAWRFEQGCEPLGACVETIVDRSGTGSILEWAFCTAEPTPDPLCDPPTGTRCLDATHIVTCLDGMRVIDVASIPDRCPLDRPYCVEPEPGIALCVADPAPSSACIGQPARAMEVCALGQAACTDAPFQQFCAEERTGVLCFHDILIETTTCPGPASFDPDGLHCIEVDAVSTSMCSN